MMSFPGVTIFGCERRLLGRIDGPLPPIEGEDELGVFSPDPLDHGLFSIPEEEIGRWTDEHCEEVETCFEAQTRAAQERKAEIDRLAAQRAGEIARLHIAGIRGDKKKASFANTKSCDGGCAKKSFDRGKSRNFGKPC
jgi:hypothetical protein